MEEVNFPKSISIPYYSYQSKFYFDGHYVIKILIYFDKDKKYDKKLLKKFSEILELYEKVILKAPGCRIPNITKTSFLINIKGSENSKKVFRLNRIEEFLNYIIKHPLLMKMVDVLEFFRNMKTTQKYKSQFKEVENNKKINESDNNKEEINDSIDKDEEFENIDLNDNKDDFEVIEKENLEEKEILPSKEYVEYIENFPKKSILNKSYLNIEYKEKYKDLKTTIYNELENEYNEPFKDYIFIRPFIEIKNEDKIKYKKFLNETKDIFDPFNNNLYKNELIKLNDRITKLYYNHIDIFDYKISKYNALYNILDIDKKYNKNLKEFFTYKIKELGFEWKSDEYCNENEYLGSKLRFSEKELVIIKQIRMQKEIIENLLDIYTRKESHIFFIYDLLKKIKTKDTKDLDKLKKSYENEIEFINKLNIELNYEIFAFKNKFMDKLINLLDENNKNRIDFEEEFFKAIQRDREDDN